MYYSDSHIIDYIELPFFITEGPGVYIPPPRFPTKKYKPKHMHCPSFLVTGVNVSPLQVPKDSYLSELHQQLGKVVRSKPAAKLPIMEDEAEDPKVGILCFPVTIFHPILGSLN